MGALTNINNLSLNLRSDPNAFGTVGDRRREDDTVIRTGFYTNKNTTFFVLLVEFTKVVIRGVNGYM